MNEKRLFLGGNQMPLIFADAQRERGLRRQQACREKDSSNDTDLSRRASRQKRQSHFKGTIASDQNRIVQVTS